MRDLITIGKLLSKRYILPKHLGISSRKVSYWKEHKILPFFPEQKHGKMNVPMAVWLFVINELSQLGIDSKRLAKLAFDVWNPEKGKQLFELKLEQILSRKDLDKNTREAYLAIKEDDLLKETMGQEHNKFVDDVVDSIFIRNYPVSFFYFPKSGKYHSSAGDKSVPLKISNLMDIEPFICIPLMPIIRKVVTIDFKVVKRNHEYLSYIENQIKDIILYKAPKYVELSVEGNHIEPLKIREEHKRPEMLCDFIMNNKLPKGSKLLIEPRSQDNYKLTIITK